MYSFERDGEWHYTLIYGTNRMKWWDEIVFEEGASDEEGVYHRIGTDEIIGLLDRLADDAGVFWRDCAGIDPVPDSGVSLTLPPDDIVNAISNYADEYGLDLYVHR